MRVEYVRLSTAVYMATTYPAIAMPVAKAALDLGVAHSSSMRECINGANVAIAMTGWPQFKTPKPPDYLRLMRSSVLVDAWRTCEPRLYGRKLSHVAVGMGTRGALT